MGEHDGRLRSQIVRKGGLIAAMLSATAAVAQRQRSVPCGVEDVSVRCRLGTRGQREHPLPRCTAYVVHLYIFSIQFGVNSALSMAGLKSARSYTAAACHIQRPRQGRS